MLVLIGQFNTLYTPRNKPIKDTDLLSVIQLESTGINSPSNFCGTSHTKDPNISLCVKYEGPFMLTLPSFKWSIQLKSVMFFSFLIGSRLVCVVLLGSLRVLWLVFT